MNGSPEKNPGPEKPSHSLLSAQEVMKILQEGQEGAEKTPATPPPPMPENPDQLESLWKNVSPSYGENSSTSPEKAAAPKNKTESPSRPKAAKSREKALPSHPKELSIADGLAMLEAKKAAGEISNETYTDLAKKYKEIQEILASETTAKHRPTDIRGRAIKLEPNPEFVSKSSEKEPAPEFHAGDTVELTVQTPEGTVQVQSLITGIRPDGQIVVEGKMFNQVGTPQDLGVKKIEDSSLEVPAGKKSEETNPISAYLQELQGKHSKGELNRTAYLIKSTFVEDLMKRTPAEQQEILKEGLDKNTITREEYDRLSRGFGGSPPLAEKKGVLTSEEQAFVDRIRGNFYGFMALSPEEKERFNDLSSKLGRAKEEERMKHDGERTKARGEYPGESPELTKGINQLLAETGLESTPLLRERARAVIETRSAYLKNHAARLEERRSKRHQLADAFQKFLNDPRAALSDVFYPPEQRAYDQALLSLNKEIYGVIEAKNRASMTGMSEYDIVRLSRQEYARIFAGIQSKEAEYIVEERERAAPASWKGNLVAITQAINKPFERGAEKLGLDRKWGRRARILATAGLIGAGVGFSAGGSVLGYAGYRMTKAGIMSAFNVAVRGGLGAGIAKLARRWQASFSKKEEKAFLEAMDQHQTLEAMDSYLLESSRRFQERALAIAKNKRRLGTASTALVLGLDYEAAHGAFVNPLDAVGIRPGTAFADYTEKQTNGSAPATKIPDHAAEARNFNTRADERIAALEEKFGKIKSPAPPEMPIGTKGGNSGIEISPATKLPDDPYKSYYDLDPEEKENELDPTPDEFRNRAKLEAAAHPKISPENPNPLTEDQTAAALKSWHGAEKYAELYGEPKIEAASSGRFRVEIDGTEGKTSVWKTLESALGNKDVVGEKIAEDFNKLTKAERIILVDGIKDTIASHKSEFGLGKVENIDVVQKGQAIDLSPLLKDKSRLLELVDNAAKTSDAAQESVLLHEKQLAAWQKTHPGETLTDKKVDEILANAKAPAEPAASLAKAPLAASETVAGIPDLNETAWRKALGFSPDQYDSMRSVRVGDLLESVPKGADTEELWNNSNKPKILSGSRREFNNMIELVEFVRSYPVGEAEKSVSVGAFLRGLPKGPKSIG